MSPAAWRRANLRGRYDISGMNDEYQSKTRRKHAMLELQALGAELVELPAARIAALGLPEDLAQAIDAARRITAHEGRRRQIQYIGRLMRDVDPAPIRAALDVAKGGSREATARQHLLERWRARLLDDDAALTEFADAHPGTDLQELRALIRNARHELKIGRPPRAFRELFAFLRASAERHEPPPPTNRTS